MATLDISLLNTVTQGIVFMLLFTVGYGVLKTVNPFKDAGGSLYALMAFFIAIVVLLSGSAVKLILSMTPWLIVLCMIGFFIIFFAKMFGTSDKSITQGFADKNGWMIFGLILVLLFTLGQTFGQSLLRAQFPQQSEQDPNTVSSDPGSIVGPATSTPDYGNNLVLTIFHPKMLGVMFIFLLGTFTIIFLNDKAPGAH